MAVKVGINGFGRIGRLVSRAILEKKSKDLELVAVGHYRCYVRRPPGAVIYGPRPGLHTGGPCRWVRCHLLDQGLDTTGDELVLPGCPPANRGRVHGRGV